MTKKPNHKNCFTERVIHNLVDKAAVAPSAATFAVHKLANVVDKCTFFADAKKQKGFIPKFTALIVIGFF
ncbi:hypothetical protein [Flavisolibacter ginsenosidimutans]|uniref:Uncharacterized protein n=1 Tax=Flavisolibacter ginsenosidimutans TaxID=661481 RepID=A0A5B8UKS8_9BACT|nr:hypothetical protein [Flavisolibacter ginsenosidimutans]QEC57284.1 hypothetical protein FSB75_15725 [Flavisolibacter ginsenosidimutans]